ncbi:hypothetical protein GDO81_010208 [Engystomops pustulosus]|uniref:Uncharacterized protein n=1 Tax=Engystomops pustulosus TaxID=76066 RepID=A0AAV7BXS5_ENGPU|nr:hypothetical protein GDO81_010208 [Engystomops pustulosus]
MCNGSPCSRKMWMKDKLARHGADGIPGNGTKWDIFENRSVTTQMTVFPEDDGRSVIKSMATTCVLHTDSAPSLSETLAAASALTSSHQRETSPLCTHSALILSAFSIGTDVPAPILSYFLLSSLIQHSVFG